MRLITAAILLAFSFTAAWSQPAPQKFEKAPRYKVAKLTDPDVLAAARIAQTEAMRKLIEDGDHHTTTYTTKLRHASKQVESAVIRVCLKIKVPDDDIGENPPYYSSTEVSYAGGVMKIIQSEIGIGNIEECEHIR